jgi:hypothetical protein
MVLCKLVEGVPSIVENRRSGSGVVIVAETTTTPHQERTRSHEKDILDSRQSNGKEVGRRALATVPGTAHIESTGALIHSLTPLGLQAVAEVLPEEVSARTRTRTWSTAA